MICPIPYSLSGQQQISLFHPTTKWEQINQWLKDFIEMSDSQINEFAFIDQKQQIVIDENRTIFEGDIDGINRSSTIKVIFSYENNTASISALKTTRVCHLLNNEDLLRQLHLMDVSPNDCVLVLGNTDEQVLSQDDTRQPVGDFCSDDHPSIQFRISILIQILKYDQQPSQQILLPNRNTTIEQMYQLTLASPDVYKYLASNYTKKILDFRENLSNLLGTKFILVQAHQTCLISISKPQCNQLINIDDSDEEIQQRFTIFATIGDIGRENKIDNDHQNLIYADDFIPSNDTQLVSFIAASPIRFTLMEGTLPVAVTVEILDDQRSIQFRCSLTTTVKRLCSIACQLFGVNEKYRGLKQDDIELDDDEVTLNDMNSTMTEIKFQLVSTASITSSIKYGDQTFLLPCSRETSAETLITETLQKLHIPQENHTLYELVALANDDRILIDCDMTIDNVYTLFSSDVTLIPFELTKKDE